MVNALVLTSVSGLATLAGGLIALGLKNRKIDTGLIMGFAAGILIFISLGELLNESAEIVGYPGSIISFFAGVLIILLADFLIPHEYGEEECCIVDTNLRECLRSNRCLLLLTLGVAIHNIPEGIAVFYSSLVDMELGLIVALAIILHNIPEGLVIVMSAKDNRGSKYGLLLAAIAGFAELAGAVLTYLFFQSFVTETVLGYMLGSVAGIMCFISFDELLPKAYTTKSSHRTIIGIFLGIAVMAGSLILLE